MKAFIGRFTRSKLLFLAEAADDDVVEPCDGCWCSDCDDAEEPDELSALAACWW